MNSEVGFFIKNWPVLFVIVAQVAFIIFIWLYVTTMKNRGRPLKNGIKLGTLYKVICMPTKVDSGLVVMESEADIWRVRLYDVGGYKGLKPGNTYLACRMASGDIGFFQQHTTN